MPINIGIPIELPLAEMTMFDMKNGVVAQVTTVYDFTKEHINQKIISRLPDGKLVRTEFHTTQDVSAMMDIVTFEKPEAEIPLMISEDNTIPIKVCMDLLDPDRFFVQAGDNIWVTARRIQCNPVPIVAIILAGGAVGLGVGSIGLGAYAVSQGYDVDITIDLDDYKLEIKLEKEDESG